MCSGAVVATRAGARLLNYTTALGPRQAGSATGRTRLRDERTGSEFDVEAGVTLLAPGSQLGPLMSSFGLSGAPPLVRAMNLLLDRPARDIAPAARSASGRMLTSVPWRGYVLAGTHQSNEAVDAGETAPPPAAVTAFLDELNAAFPKLHASLADVRMIHHGLTIPRGSLAGIKGGFLGPILNTYPSEMAQNFWTAIFAWTSCFVATIVISMVTTRQKSDEDLKGLVYSLTPRQPDATLLWYKRPATLGVLVLGLTLVLNIIFW